MNDELRHLLERQGVLLADGKLPALAGAATPGEVTSPVADPLGGPTVSGTEVTVDELLQEPTRIPNIIRNLTAANQGYFMDEVFATPGIQVQGGALIYEQTFPENYFLPAGKDLAPRAPGTPAPRLAATRHVPQIARPESWSGSIEVHDEARRRNQVYAIQRQFTQMANSFIDTIQRRGLEVLKSFIEESERHYEAANKWSAEHIEGAFKVDPAKLPQHDFAKVNAHFMEDKAGRMPNLVILHPEDALRLDEIYSGGFTSLTSDQVMGRYGLTAKVTPHATKGEAIFLEAKAVGLIAYETPLRQEYTRVGERFTDVYTVEMTPVFVAFDASAILAVTAIS